MPLRRRLALTVALVALVVVILAGAAAWITTRSILRGTIDDTLRAQARVATRGPRLGVPGQPPIVRPGDPSGFRAPAPPARQGGPSEYQQVLRHDGSILLPGEVALPVAADDKAVITGVLPVEPRDVTVGDAHLRMITVPLSAEARAIYLDRRGLDIAAIQFARPLNGVDSALRTLWVVLLVLGAIIVGIAALLGRATARRILRPVSDLAEAAEHVEATADLDRRLPVRSNDEVGELTRRFNGMLGRLQRSRNELDRSMTEQRNLVADASHELRTPVTSLRTNAEVLLEGEASLTPADRRAILADVRDQAEDLGRLVSDLIELARGDHPDHGADEPIALDAVVQECATRARRDHRGVTFRVETVPATVIGRPDRLARAIGNLLDNAALHGADGAGTVEVRVREGGGRPAGVDHLTDRSHPPVVASSPAEVELSVVDHGPGVPVADRERIFDRFRRGDASRKRHGSGLGLAIVRQVAGAHGGSVRLGETPGGGATFVLALPVAAEG